MKGSRYLDQNLHKGTYVHVFAIYRALIISNQ